MNKKGDYQDALTNYNIVKQLVADNAANTKIINNDIDTLNNRVAAAQKGQQTTQKQPTPSVTPEPQNAQQPIGVNKPATQPLPTRVPRETIPGPSNPCTTRTG